MEDLERGRGTRSERARSKSRPRLQLDIPAPPRTPIPPVPRAEWTPVSSHELYSPVKRVRSKSKRSESAYPSDNEASPSVVDSPDRPSSSPTSRRRKSRTPTAHNGIELQNNRSSSCVAQDQPATQLDEESSNRRDESSKTYRSRSRKRTSNEFSNGITEPEPVRRSKSRRPSDRQVPDQNELAGQQPDIRPSSSRLSRKGRDSTNRRRSQSRTPTTVADTNDDLASPKSPNQYRESARKRKSADKTRQLETNTEHTAQPTAVEKPPPSVFDNVGKQPSDFDGYITSVSIHGADSIALDPKIMAPLVQVHFVDIKSGEYLIKSDPNRPVTTFNEAGVDYILPVITKPYKFLRHAHTPRKPKWEEEFLLNEDYKHIVRENVLILFEMLNVVTDRALIASGRSDGWHRVAYAFCKLVPSPTYTNTEHQRLRLQLYQYPSNILWGKAVGRVPHVYRCWRGVTVGRGIATARPPPLAANRKKYDGTLYVSICGKTAPPSRLVTRRPEWAGETEVGKVPYEDMLEVYNSKKRALEPMYRSLANLVKKPMWRRHPSQACRLPNKLMYRIEPGSTGAFSLAFSNNGIFLAVGCCDAGSYPIRIYDVLSGDRVANLEGHRDLVYELVWSRDDDVLMSTSSDGSVRLWKFMGDGNVRPSLVLQHPCFVYSAVLHPIAPLIFTGSFDTQIRAWSSDPTEIIITSRPQSPTQDTRHLPHARSVSRATTHSSGGRSRVHPTTSHPTTIHPTDTYKGHENYVNALAFDSEGVKMYSGDGNGCLKVWSCRVDTTEGYDKYQCIKTVMVDEASPITSIRMHPSNRRILVHSLNGTPRLLDTRIYRFTTTFQTPPLTSTSSSAPNCPITAITSTFTRASFSPCGTQVWAGGSDGVVRVWNADNGTVLGSYEGLGFRGQISAVEYHPKDYLVAMCCVGDRQPVLIFSWDESPDVLEGFHSAAAGSGEIAPSAESLNDATHSKRASRTSDYYADVIQSNPQLRSPSRGVLDAGDRRVFSIEPHRPPVASPTRGLSAFEGESRNTSHIDASENNLAQRAPYKRTLRKA
ncbi:hypothetical protein SmJEL517_g00911 [Synchytrium microbalum]|uniref:Uncharacterized protein n=1 Tax=Synchytrium microbalum TaxID=1806994 RepID=A0A507CC63_9FUNG|nr:uncharacterized protein SmJEL517_g00911 [Synchytrium microbalum]TPX36928.1 hypothetical protein SmJEL517_g00911 [Synchytrium microbalum]